MDITQFSGEYEAIAALYGMAPDELRERDSRLPHPVRRWLASSDGVAIGAATVWSRPDDRTFIRFVGADPDVRLPLTEAVAGILGRSVYTFVDADDGPALEALRAAGFRVELVEEAFRIRFDRALALVDRAWIPKGFSIHQADAVDEDRLFELDNTLRQDTPGTDGWRGDRRWFHEEFAESPPFDPSAYLVAIEDQSGEHIGLLRIWRNPNGPRFGLIGVVRNHRNTPIAAALLKEALNAAASLGRFLQMVRRY